MLFPLLAPVSCSLQHSLTPEEQLLKMSEKLQEQFPRASDIEADIKKQEESASKERRATRLSQRLNV